MKQRFLSLDEYINENKQVNETAEQAAVQKALKDAGFDLKQSEFKVGVKKDGALGKKIYLNGTYLGNDDNWDTMVTKFTKYIQEDPKKFGLNESSITASIVPGAEVNIMDMKGIVTEITQTWNGTVYEFNFKNDLGEDHSAVFIGDKFILRESEELNEGAEELKAYDAIKAAMFKIQKALEPVLKKADEIGIIKRYKIDIKPYNGGLQLSTGININWNREIAEQYAELTTIFSNMTYINIHPATFFQDRISEGKPSEITYRTIALNEYDSEYNRKDIRNKADIKKAIDEIGQDILDKIETINRMF